jgi:purine nucleosidase
MKFPTLTAEERADRLTPPTGIVRAVIDSDTYNEVDDQFAIAYALQSPERINVEAVYAAPFSSAFLAKMLNADSGIPMTTNLEEGLEQSYQEILHLFSLLDRDPEHLVFRGSSRYLSNRETPVQSEAAQDLIRRAHESDDPLYVIAIGEITNIASAILMDPSIIRKIVVVWLAGQPIHWPHTIEFNLGQDLLASQLIVECGVPLVLVPCMSVASNLTVTAVELEHYMKGTSRVADYLTQIVTSQLTQEMDMNWLRLFHQTYNKGLDDYGAAGVPTTTTMLSPSRIIWDVSTVAYLVNPTWCPSALTEQPCLTDDIRWAQGQGLGHAVRVCNYIYRDAVFGDMFEKLAKAPK